MTEPIYYGPTPMVNRLEEVKALFDRCLERAKKDVRDAEKELAELKKENELSKVR